MAQPETLIVTSIMLEASKSGARVWKNIRGFFYTNDSVKALKQAIKTANWGLVIKTADNLRAVRAGIQAEGSSDLVGFVPTVITQDMVGQTIAVCCFIEVKTETGRIAPEQQSFINFIVKSGGYAGIARSVEDAKRIMRV